MCIRDRLKYLLKFKYLRAKPRVTASRTYKLNNKINKVVRTLVNARITGTDIIKTGSVWNTFYNAKEVLIRSFPKF